MNTQRYSVTENGHIPTWALPGQYESGGIRAGAWRLKIKNLYERLRNSVPKPPDFTGKDEQEGIHMKKLALVCTSLLLALSLAGCSVPVVNQSNQASTESGSYTKPGREQTESSQNATMETDPTTAGREQTVPAEPSVPATEEPVMIPPAFTEENITPYNGIVTDLAYAVLQRGSDYSLSGSREMTRSEAGTRFKLDTDGALFEYCYRNDALLLDPVFGGTYDAERNIRYCRTDQDEISRTLKALLDLEIKKEDFPGEYDSRTSPLCIWNQNGLFLCLPMMGEAPGAVWKNLELAEGKALLYADVFEPFNNVPTDRLVVTLVPAKNELGFTIESISLNPNAAADLPDGTYHPRTFDEHIDEILPRTGYGYERNYNTVTVDYKEGVEMTVTLKSNGQYIKLTKDYLETTFSLDGLIGYDEHIKTQGGELIRIPVSPAIRNDIANWLQFMEWIFTEGAFELFCFEIEDGMMTSFNTIS